jgi:large subunit ribosomal protein L29
MGKKTPFKEYQVKSMEELSQLVTDLAEKKFTLRVQHPVGQLENTAEIRKTRRDLARAKMALGDKVAQRG